MNLRSYSGRVPIAGTDPNIPIILVDFPDKEMFHSLYSKSTAPESVERYWIVVQARNNGATLSEAGALVGISKERARQIETKFIRLLAQRHHGK